MVRTSVIMILLLLCRSVVAQYSDTLRVSQADADSAIQKHNVNRFDYLSCHVDPQIIYAQQFFASNGFTPKLMKNNNSFQMKDQNGKRRKFKTEKDEMARFVLAIADYDMKEESYTDYLERKPKSNWSPAMSKKLLEIFRGLYGYDYDYKKQFYEYEPEPWPLHFVCPDSLKEKDNKSNKSYSKKYEVSRTDRNIIQTANYLGPITVLACHVDTQLVFTQIMWATDHFNTKLTKDNNLFQLLDENGKMMKFETIQDAMADYLLRILDYDKKQESYLAYLERKSGGWWTQEMSDKLRAIYKSLYRKEYDERFFPGYVKKNKNRGVRSSRSKSRLLSDE